MKALLEAAQFAELFEKAAVPIFVLDAETGANLAFNAAAADWSGYSGQELASMSLLDLRPPEDRERTLAFLKHLVAESLIETLEMPLRRKDGEERRAVLHSKAVTAAGRRVLQIFIIDQTELRRAQAREKELSEQLLKTERLSAVGQMAAGIGHELRNPLGAVQNAVYYAKEALKGHALLVEDPTLGEVLGLAEKEIATATRILSDLQEFSRPVRLELRSCDVNALIRQTLRQLDWPPDVDVAEALDASLPKALLDPSRVGRVLLHLVQNALQAMPEGGRLEVSSSLDGRRDGGWVRVSVKDSGLGMGEEVLPKIFEPLFSTKPRGAGLGLAVSLAYVRAHGGSIAAASRPGSGSEFVVALPLGGPQSGR